MNDFPTIQDWDRIQRSQREPLPHRCRAANLTDVKFNPGKVLAHCVLAEGHKSPHEDFDGHMWSKVVR